MGGEEPHVGCCRKLSWTKKIRRIQVQACDLSVNEDQEHLAKCEGYEDLRGEADLGDEKELVEFFSRVMERRKEQKWS